MAGDDVSLKISATATQAIAELGRLSSQVKAAGAAGTAAGAQLATGFGRARAGVQSISEQLQTLQTRLVQIGSAAAAFSLARDATQTAIAFEGYANALKAVTGSSEAAGDALAFIRSESDRLGINLRSSTEQFVQLSAAAQGTTLAGQGIRDVFTAVAEAGVVLGLRNDQLSGAFTALQQILSKGSVSAEELRQQLGERLAGSFQTAARSLGITTQELGKLLEQGLVPAEQFLPRFAAQLRKDFGDGVAGATSGARAEIERFNTALTDLQLAFASSGFLDALAASFRDITASLSSPGLREGVQAMGEFVGSALRFVVQNADKIAQAFGAIAGAAAGARVGRFAGPTGALVGAGLGFAAGGVGTARALGQSGNDPNAASEAEARERLPAVQRRVEQLREQLLVARASLREAIALELQQVGETAGQLQSIIDEAVAERQRAMGPPRPPPRNSFPPFVLQPGAGDRKNQRPFTGPQVDFAEIAVDQNQRALRELQASFDAAEIALQEFLDNRLRLTTATIDAEIAQERRRLDEAIKARQQEAANRAATNIARLEARRAQLPADQEREAAALARRQADERVQLTAQRLEQEGRLEDAARVRLEIQFRDTLARLGVEGDTAGVAIVNSIINTEASRARFQELQRQAERAQTELQARLQAIANQRESGTLSYGAAEQATTEARNRTIEQLSALNTEFQNLAARTNDPMIAAGAEAVTVALERLRRDGLTGTDLAIVTLRGQLDGLQRNLSANLAQTGVNALNTLFTNLASGSMSAADAVRAAALQIIQQLAAMAAQALATRIALSFLGVPAGGGGGWVSGESLPVGRFHSGGIVGQGGATMRVPAWTFAGAPRLHSGLKPDEFPAILQTGEQVLSRQEVAAQNRGGGAQSLRIINSIDPGLVADYMASAEGERVIVNTLSRNRGQVKQLLG